MQEFLRQRIDKVEEDLYKLGDGLWVHEKYLAYFEKPKDIDIILYQTGVPGDEDDQWMAIAPEWVTALGFGSTKEQASEDLQSKLALTKQWFIEDKVAHGIEKVLVKPCKENAEKVCNSLWEVNYYNKLEKDSTHWEWSTIRA
ncbi:hypothetical protein COCOBI_15-1630 [Coccomyxa sp. Obi]|nr:hypothetical protein COCOBI_15-1630 [Coccomyxa sp. Obi]